MMSVSKINRSVIIKWIISLCLGGLFFLLPTTEILSLQVKCFLFSTVFCLALAAFELAPLLFIFIMLPVLYILLQVAPATVVMAPWTSLSPFMILGAIFLSVTLEECGLLRRIAFYLMCKVKGNYFLLLLGLMITTILMNIAISGNGYIIVAALAAGMCLSLGVTQTNTGVGIATAIFLGGAQSHAWTYEVSGIVVINGAAGDLLPAGALNPLDYLIHNWPVFFISLFTLWIVSKWYKPEESLGDASYFKEQLAAMGKMSRKEKVNFVMLIILLLFIFTSKIHKLDVSLAFVIIPWMVFLPGLNGADENTIKKMDFSFVFFVTACMAIGIVASTLGLGDVLSDFYTGLLGDSSNPFKIIALIFIVVFALNFLMTPMAIYALITPGILTMVLNLGYNTLPFAYAIKACCEAILLPYEAVPYLVIYSFGMISMKDFIKINIVRSILFFVGLLILLVPYWMLIGLL